jgi:hypothetical protein
MNDSPSQYTRREAIVSASQGALALTAMAALTQATQHAEAAEPSAQAAGSVAPITDFERSYVRFRIDTTKKPPKTISRKLPMTLNNVRMTLDSRVAITHEPSGRVYDYVLSASCKSEQVWVDRDVWHEPNADMCMLAGADEFLVYKRWDKTDKGVLLYPPSLGVQPEKQLGDPRETFDRFSIDRATRPGRVLETVDAIIEALFAATPVVAQTEYQSGDYHVLLEYPVKTVNFSERERYYQVDTGPILLPDFTTGEKSLLAACRLAYVAHNKPDWAEFIVCVPTPVSDQIKVHHYSQSVRLEGVKNRLIAVV